MMEPIVVIGTGLAGYTLARELRKLNKDVPLTMITRDDGAFYSKPMLSNALSGGKTPAQLALFSAADMAQQLRGEVLSNATVTAIDPAGHRVTVQDAHGAVRDIKYRSLVLAWGAEPVHADVTGDGLDAIFSVNDLSDYARFRAALERAQRVAILGAGLVGCEFANDLRAAGKTVHVIDPAHGPLPRLLPPEGQAALKEALAHAGVQWHLGSLLAALHRRGSACTAVLKRADATGEQTELEVDLVLSAIGLRPRVHLARSAGLEVKRAIVVDRFLRTSAENVYALGDCAEVEGHVLLFVQPLMNAARALAKTLNGDATPVIYPAMPVVVKTPAYPVVVLLPPEHWPGHWTVDASTSGVKAVFTDPNGWPRGFALTGAATAEKTALAKKVPGLIE